MLMSIKIYYTHARYCAHEKLTRRLELLQIERKKQVYATKKSLGKREP